MSISTTRNFILVLSMAILLTACWIMGDAKKMGQLSMGMTKPEVLRIMQHDPDRVSATGNIEYLIYKERRDEYFIRLRDGKVDAYGKKGDFDSTKDPTMNLNIKYN